MDWHLLIPDPATRPLVAFGFGLIIGSFLNACAYRIPREISVVAPRSFCPECGTLIPWHHNIPVLSWLLLRGQAACCGTRIHWFYPVVEFLTAVLFAAIFWVHPLPVALAYAAFSSLLIIGMITDFEHLIIPDRVTLGGAVLGIACSVLVPALHGAETWKGGLNSSLAGAALGGGVLWAVAAAGSKLLNREAMGQGDVKLMMCIGGFLGWQATVFSIALGSVIGAVAGLAVLFARKEKIGSFLAIPFGPPLMLSAILWTFGGRQWWDAYFAVFREQLDR